MNVPLISLEIGAVLAGLALLLADLWTPAAFKRYLGYGAAAAVAILFAVSWGWEAARPEFAFGGMYVLDEASLFFKRFFLAAGFFVLLLSVQYSARIAAGTGELYALMLFALAGMLFAASANDFALVFVSLELITVTFYVLVGFHRHQVRSLEAGVKYLILGAISSAILVYGIALVYGATGTTSFAEIRALYQTDLAGEGALHRPLLVGGMLLVLAGLSFKIAAFPFLFWAPDVYEGGPTPVTAFLAVGSKAAGFAFLIRIVTSVAPDLMLEWQKLLLIMAGVTILYGNLCALPQRNLKRLMGYSSMAHAGYMLLGVAALSGMGVGAVLYYLGAYMFTVLAAFAVISAVISGVDGEDIDAFSGLNRRSPLLAFALSLAMISLAGIPPLAGFFGKFLLFRAAIEQGAVFSGFYWAVGVAVIGVVISFYYYLKVVRVVYWGQPSDAAESALRTPLGLKVVLAICIAAILYLGILPNRLVNATNRAGESLAPLEQVAAPPSASVR